MALIEYTPPPELDPPALVQPEQIEPIRKRKRDRDRYRMASPYVIGAIILLSDGSRCQIVQVEPEPLCVPVPPPDQ